MSGGLHLDRYRVVICLGPGGVGKTTISAAIALDAAIGGRRVDVMTVDPAPRLMDALGLTADIDELQVVPLPGSRKAHRGRLRALRIDPKRTFDALIARHAPSASARDAILSGRIYQNLSNALAGVADYMAMERLLGIHQDAEAELIILDTPPAADALDFLDAPRRMIELMGSRALSLLGVSRGLMRGPLGVFDLAARAVLAAFDRLTGLHLLADVQAFVRSFDGMYDGFAARAAQAQTLIAEASTLIVVVTTPEADCVAQVAEFADTLGKMGLKVGAVVVNRVMAPLPEASVIDHAALPAATKRKLHQNLADYKALKQREDQGIDALHMALPALPILEAPELRQEPRSLRDLAAIAGKLHAL